MKQPKQVPFDRSKQRAYLAELRMNKASPVVTAAAVGVESEQVRRQSLEDPSFAAELAQAEKDVEADKIVDVEDALYQAAVGGNVTAIQVFLSNRAPERWNKGARSATTTPPPPEEPAASAPPPRALDFDELPTSILEAAKASAGIQ